MDPNQQQEQQAVEYEPPQITEVGAFGEVTKGQYSKNRSDDGDAGGYFPG
ncbi:lasso RiPP family leader peptide-containing protein [Amycolatopsis anabasis]|nr:lasso RiPP family leader peptide-containing protein [Amycolatopsis anabasis]